jgi:hypothetical protein
MKMRKYYGFRFYSGYHTTIGNPNANTGWRSIAGETVAFDSLDSLNEWIMKENISQPCGLGGGIRERVSRKKIRELNSGMSVSDFIEMLENFN